MGCGGVPIHWWPLQRGLHWPGYLRTHVHEAGSSHVAEGWRQEKQGTEGLLGLYAGVGLPSGAALEQVEGGEARELSQEHAHCLQGQDLGTRH